MIATLPRHTRFTAAKNYVRALHQLPEAAQWMLVALTTRSGTVFGSLTGENDGLVLSVVDGVQGFKRKTANYWVRMDWAPLARVLAAKGWLRYHAGPNADAGYFWLTEEAKLVLRRAGVNLPA